MTKSKYFFLCITLSLLTCLTSCTTPASSSDNPSQSQSTQKYQNDESKSSSSIPTNEVSEDEFLQKVTEKGLEEWQLKTLGNLGFLQKEILALTDAEIAKIFAPGTQLDGGAFTPTEEQVEALDKLGIDMEKSVILFNLGYVYEDMLTLTPAEIDFIFPNTELIDNLVNAGFKREDVINIGALQDIRKKNYKEVIKEALQR